LEPGISAVARQLVTSGASDFPPFFLVEAMAQLGGIAASREEGGGGILAAIERAEFKGTPVAGDILTISVRIIKSFGQLHLVEGEVRVGDKQLATAIITLKVGTV
jgi:3-hydroxyacyl-[acyl-carrier-protein] dehydratase